MPIVKLLSWHGEVAAKALSLTGKGVSVDAAPLERTSAVIGELARLNPAALVLDLDKRPSQSREIAFLLRANKSARHIPILFAGGLPAEDGLPERFSRLRSELPDIPYAVWPDALAAVKKLMEEPRMVPNVVPPQRVYTASLAQKLGILFATSKAAEKARQIALMGAPEGFIELLRRSPGDRQVHHSAWPGGRSRALLHPVLGGPYANARHADSAAASQGVGLDRLSQTDRQHASRLQRERRAQERPCGWVREL